MRFHLYTVPGQMLCEASRRLVLQGVDGVVFVADSDPLRLDANAESAAKRKGSPGPPFGQAVNRGPPLPLTRRATALAWGAVNRDSETHREWDRLREEMVRRQLRGRGIRDPLVLRAMGRVPRHEFVSGGHQAMAYDDTPLPIGEGQTISQPYMVALMTEALSLGGTGKVLEVGTGSGYQAAVLAEMGCTVHTIEREAALARDAAARLKRLGYSGVRVHLGDGTLGLAEEAPFRGIVVTAGGPRVPERLRSQLDPEGGILVIPVGDRGYQELVRVTRKGGRFTEENLGGCRFVPLLGEEGW